MTEINWSLLSDLGDTIASNRKKQQVSDALAGATGPDGKLDAGVAATTLARLGYPDEARPFLSLAQQQAALTQSGSQFQQTYDESVRTHKANERIALLNAQGGVKILPLGAGAIDAQGKVVREPGLGADTYDPYAPPRAPQPMSAPSTLGLPPGEVPMSMQVGPPQSVLRQSAVAPVAPQPIATPAQRVAGAFQAATGGPPLPAGGQPQPDVSVPAPAPRLAVPNPPPAMYGTSSDALAAESERYAQTGRVGQGYTNNRDPIAATQARAIRSYGVALAKSRGIEGEELAQMWLNSPRWAGWLMGQDGRAVGALGTVIDHLDTARELFKALGNGNTQLINRAVNAFTTQFGGAAPTNLQAAGQLVGTEVMKAIGAAGAGSAEERITAANAIADLGKSPAQAAGAVDTLQKLIAGQLRTKQRQADAIDLPKGKFEKLVGKRALDVLGSIDAQAGGGGGQPSGGGQSAPSAPLPRVTNSEEANAAMIAARAAIAAGKPVKDVNDRLRAMGAPPITAP